MFRLFARVLYGLIACSICVLIVALVLSNREEVILALRPLPYELAMPLFLVIAVAFLLGLGTGLLLYMRLKLKASLECRKLRRQLASAKTS